MFEFMKPHFRYIRSRHNLPYESARGNIPVTSVVIPCTGEDFIAEAKLSALFASRFAPGAEEIVIVSDRSADEFGELPDRTRVVTLEVPFREESYRYKQIYRSRLIKLQAPLQAKTDGILMIDSDLNLLKMPDIQMHDGHIYSSFRQGRMIAKLMGAPEENRPAYYRNSVRPFIVDHVNGAFLAATRKTWQRICPLWLTLFQDTWALMDDSQPPTDQLPLAALLDMLDLKTVNLGDWMNWPVSKKIGGATAAIPGEVVGAHGGFPLSEWQKYLESPDAQMTFKGQDYTRKVRYLTDDEKKG
ncbi:glycosyltransferase family A protein [Erwinia sp. 9145]|uniref:glycosyltransferase family A protein n=1 Tax=Erwinia sp. 9145 TaxID=1500895 RepID=UPI000557206A|nr:glycosyltransferase family A protein [Erwinia sp. 9145]